VLVRWGIKTRTNDELRQNFVNQIVPELHKLGFSVPDPDLFFDESTENWVYGQIDWDEFWAVVKGRGPMNAFRMRARKKAHDDGRWVREALEAYVAKYG
jgi:ring-1,2-phenylacetyl-CoA epoxidase subunit PaaA